MAAAIFLPVGNVLSVLILIREGPSGLSCTRLRVPRVALHVSQLIS